MSVVLNHLAESSSSGDSCWDLSSFDIGSLDKRVVSIYLIAHENEFNQGSSGRPLVNHWSIYLATSRKHAVQIDMCRDRRGVAQLPGVVGLVDRDTCFPLRNAAAFVLAVPLVRHRKLSPWRVEAVHLSVEDIVSVIVRNGRDRYIIQPADSDGATGDDQRFWVYTVVSDFVREGIVEEKERVRARKALIRYWPFPKGSRSIPRPFVKGTFC